MHNLNSKVALFDVLTYSDKGFNAISITIVTEKVLLILAVKSYLKIICGNLINLTGL